MGYVTEFNWVLNLKPEQGLDEKNIEIGTEYKFSKKDNRVYPLNKSILLVNKGWIAVGMVKVTEFTNRPEGTAGKYVVIDIFKEEERKLISNKLFPDPTK